MKYKVVLGLEVHAELATQSKMFCECPADHFAVEANTQVCPVCLGLPGALPVANAKAIEDTLKFGLAMGCTVGGKTKFDRKHYFYPDLPKAYQISQYDLPLARDGKYTLESGKTIRIKRIHLEEDTGKLLHQTVNGKKVSLIDFNRSGVPLMELVTEPDFESEDEVDEFLREVQQIVRFLGISTADMEKGSMRLEANISLQETGAKELPDYKVELKNINSFRFLKNAIKAEVERQGELLEAGKKVPQETRGYDEASGTTFSQRSKEEAHDYRYFPEPDIPPMDIKGKDIEAISSVMPELPKARRARFAKEFQIPADFIAILTATKERSDYFETAVDLAKKHQISAKLIANMMVNQNLDKEFEEPAGLVKKIVELEKRSYSDSEETAKAVKETIKENPEVVQKIKEGNPKAIGFLVGQVQQKLKGQGDPKLVSQKLTALLYNKG